jgi:hypothetical protein
MRKIINGTKINMKEAEQLVIDTYELVNGWINPINKSKSLTIQSVKTKDIGGLAFMTNVVLNIGFLKVKGYISTMKKVLDTGKWEYLESNLETHLVALTIHELSHLDQDFLAYNVMIGGIEQENMYAVEAANEFNALKFLNDHKDELEEKLDIKINAKWHVIDCIYSQFQLANYVHIKELSQVSNRLLRKFTGRNLDVLINDCKEKDATHILVHYDGNYYNPIEKDGLVALDNILGYSYKTYNTTVKIEDVLGVKAMVIDLVKVGNSDYPYLVYWDYSGMVAA